MAGRFKRQISWLMIVVMAIIIAPAVLSFKG